MLLCGEWNPAQGAVDFSPSGKVPLGRSLSKSLWKWMAHGELTHGCYLPPSHTPPQRPHPPITVIPSISEKATLISCGRSEQVPFMDGVAIKIQLQIIIESDFSLNCQVQDFVFCYEAAFFFLSLNCPHQRSQEQNATQASEDRLQSKGHESLYLSSEPPSFPMRMISQNLL